jgi:3-oxoacyl-[acyl-carrier protein] reductase
MNWMPDLSAETAIVTGGTRNIGLAIAHALQWAGASVCVVGGGDTEARNAAVTALGGEGSRVMGRLAEVSDETAVSELFTAVEDRLGPVTILINGAAFRPGASFTELSLEEWNAVHGVILTGAFLTARELFRRLPAERRGAVVNIGGLSAHRGARRRAHVISAKAGLVGLTRALAEEGAGRIRANCVVPGSIDTARRPGQAAPHDSGSDRPLGRSEDVARMVLPLADPSQAYVTGQTIHVNGGRLMP